MSSSGWSAWLNGKFLGSYLGDSSTEQANLTLSFTNVTVNPSTPNVLLVVHDDTGHDETTGALNPRGILDFKLLGSSTSFSHWRLAGTAGGESNLDPVRGVYNEDGLYGERVGWHLPGFDDSTWTSASKQQTVVNGLTSSVLSFQGATVRFFRTVIPLQLPSSHDISISFILSTPTRSTTSYRAQLFVNGYQYKRYNPHIGNQVVYPVPAGILDYNGENTIGVVVWAQNEEGATITVGWRVNYVADSSLEVVSLGEGLRPRWSEQRERFA